MNSATFRLVLREMMICLVNFPVFLNFISEFEIQNVLQLCCSELGFDNLFFISPGLKNVKIVLIVSLMNGIEILSNTLC